MSEIHTRTGSTVTARAVNLLALAAAPTFAVMAVLTGALDPPDMRCSTATSTSPLSGMAVMYLLMSAFHSGSWLKWVARQGNGPLWIGSGPRHAPTRR